ASRAGMELRLVWLSDSSCYAPFRMLFSRGVEEAPAVPAPLKARPLTGGAEGHALLIDDAALASGDDLYLHHYFYVLARSDMQDPGSVVAELHEQSKQLAPSALVAAKLQGFQNVDFNRSIGIHVRRHFDDKFAGDRQYDEVSDLKYALVVLNAQKSGY